jgi:para-nitrobenzyl esterase
VRRTLLAIVVAVATTVVAVTVAVALVSGDDPAPTDPSTSAASQELVPMDEVVGTTQGDLRGVTNGGLRGWLGIPYAAPPVDRLRWRAPKPGPTWDGVRAAGSFGAPCLQPSSYTFGDDALTARPGSSEDCLYLNVVRPDDDSRDLPVVVWLHGGGFFAGNGNTAIADGAELVERGIVLVTVNYRLGQLGFFAHPSLEEGYANFGLLDQVAALEWVRDNVEQFGGDRGNVTLAGGSAGGMSVNALMAAPSAEGLFVKAIAQSAPSDHQASTLDVARARGEVDFPGLTASELRALPGDRLLSSTFNTLSGDAPVLDRFLPRSSADVFADGTEAQIPYLLGTTADEFSDDDYRSFGVDPDGLRARIGGDEHDAVVAAYGDDYDTHVLDDLVFRLPTVERAVLHGRRSPTFRYVLRGTDYSGHGAEAAYMFDTVDSGPGAEMSDAVADYWVAFARTGRPDVEGLPGWPEANGDGASAYLVLQPEGPEPVAADPDVDRLAVLRRTAG